MNEKILASFFGLLLTLALLGGDVVLNWGRC